MPFIGKQPQAGAYSKLDAITTSATATYNLTLDSGAYYPQSANHLLVSLNGVIQAPQDSFTVSGSQIIFDSALTSADVIDFIIALGDTLDIGVPSAGSVNTSQLANGAVTSAKLDTNIDIAGTLDVTSHTTLDSGLSVAGAVAVAGHSSIGNAGTVDSTRALTVVGATDGTGSSIIVGYNSSLSSKFGVRDDGYTTIGAGMNVQGNITLASGAGIDFSGNANHGGTTSELLDDYEEGTSQVSVSGITASTNTVSMNYVKVGSLVHIIGEVLISGKSANSGNANFALPFTPSGTYSFTSTVGATIHYNTISSSIHFFGLYGGNASVYGNNSGTYGNNYISGGSWTDGRIGFTLTYTTF